MRQQDLAVLIALLLPKGGPAEDDGQRRPSRIPAWADQQQRYQEQSAAGDGVAAAILRMAPPDWSKAEERMLASLRRHGAQVDPGPDGWTLSPEVPPMLDAMALGALAAQAPQDAALLFAVKLAIAGPDEADTLCSLSYCAASQGEFGDALVLAQASLALNPAHPRARCILGLCQLQSGHRKLAQSSLALAARIARSNRDYAEVLQAAQRLLLILHLEE